MPLDHLLRQARFGHAQSVLSTGPIAAGIRSPGPKVIGEFPLGASLRLMIDHDLLGVTNDHPSLTAIAEACSYRPTLTAPPTGMVERGPDVVVIDHPNNQRASGPTTRAPPGSTRW